MFPHKSNCCNISMLGYITANDISYEFFFGDK